MCAVALGSGETDGVRIGILPGSPILMTRRTFLRTVALAAATTVTVGVVHSRNFVARLFRRGSAWLTAMTLSPAQQLRAHFEYLDLDPVGVERYFQDCLRYRPDFSRRMALRDEDYTRYLLSSDFFRHDADESRRIQYVRFYDPSVGACGNPFARFEA
jgi:hypothetical protein